MKRKSFFSILSTYYYLVLVLLYLPMLVLFLFSINDGVAFSFPLQGVTSHWYTDMLENAELLRAVRNSILVAIASSSLTSILATAAALALTRFHFKGKEFFLIIALMPL